MCVVCCLRLGVEVRVRRLGGCKETGAALVRRVHVLRHLVSTSTLSGIKSRFFRSLGLHWSSPESGDLWHKTGGSKETVWSRSEGWLYRGTSIMRKRPPLGPYSRNLPRVIWQS